MESTSESSNENKLKSKTHSFHKSMNNHDGLKRKTIDDIAESLNLELGHLKKTKLLNGELRSPFRSSQPHIGRMSAETKAHGVDVDISSEVENVSLMSINFSQYELMRNLSHSNIRSDGGSHSTCSTLSLVDRDLKNEHLERYFRSVDKWNKQFEETNSDSPEKM